MYQAAAWQDLTQEGNSKDATATTVASITFDAIQTDCVESLYRH